MTKTTIPPKEPPHPHSKEKITVRCKSETELAAMMIAAADNGVICYVNFQRDRNQGSMFMHVHRKHARTVAGVLRRAHLPYAGLLEAEYLSE